MFGGMKFRMSVAGVLADHFDYHTRRFSSEQLMTFKGVCADVRYHEGNKFDAAIIFMIAMVSSLTDLSAFGDTARRWVNTATSLLEYTRLRKTETLVREQYDRLN